jgi:hypothetical protein
MGAGRALKACDAEKTSAAMVFCDENCALGGEEEFELKEPCKNGLLDKLEGLVLLGLGPPAILSFVLPLFRRASRRQRGVRSWRVEACEANKCAESGPAG